MQIHISDFKIFRLIFIFKFQNCPDFQISENSWFFPGEVLNSDLGVFFNISSLKLPLGKVNSENPKKMSLKLPLGKVKYFLKF